VSKRAADLEPGDVIHEPPWMPFQKVKSVHGPYGAPPWVSVRFDPVHSKAYGIDERVEVLA
jgi:hypothetical protein